MPQWIAREYLARRGNADFTAEQVLPARCPLAGYALRNLMLEGQTLTGLFLRPETQPEMGDAAYDEGARILKKFFDAQLSQFLESDLHPLGRKIIDCCLANGSIREYEQLIPQSFMQGQ
jgi:hypothetical protein